MASRVIWPNDFYFSWLFCDWTSDVRDINFAPTIRTPPTTKAPKLITKANDPDVTPTYPPANR